MTKEEVIARNNKILQDRYCTELEIVYDQARKHKCDVNDAFPILRRYASRCKHVTEFGTRGVNTTYALLAAKPENLVSYDINQYSKENQTGALRIAKDNGVNLTFVESDTLVAEIEQTDLLFIDTLHTYGQLSAELNRHAGKVRKYILLHDTNTWGIKDEVETTTEKHGLKLAISEFLLANPEWELREERTESNGLTVLERHGIKTTIVVPSNNTGNLKVCMESVLKFTDLSDKEIIVVSNGCGKDMWDFLRETQNNAWWKTYKNNFNFLWFNEEIGYPKAVNEGVKCARGNEIVLLDDDAYLLQQTVDDWIRILREPFVGENKSTVGLTGIFGSSYPYLGQAMHSGCIMIDKQVWQSVSGFDESYGVGYLSDVDFSIRIRNKNLQLINVGLDGTFPLFHPQSPVDVEKKHKQVKKMRENRRKLYKAHRKVKYSIIIPTYNHLEDCLKPCLTSLLECTDLSEVEVLVVANGCKDGTTHYIDSLGAPFDLIEFDSPMGFTKSTNAGIREAQGEYIILLNNDCKFLPQNKQDWINLLEAPFQDKETGITGPLILFDRYANHEVVLFFCAMIPRRIIDAIGYLDEIFSPGGGEDVDYCVRVAKAGFKLVQVPSKKLKFTYTNEGSFPIWHVGEGTFTEKDMPEYSNYIVKRNGVINMLRYNKAINLNMGSGGVEIPGYLSVDKYDKRAAILSDVFELDMPENSVNEIIASHLFEHINVYKSVALLQKWNKMLKPGGKLIMELPNFTELCKRFLSGDKSLKYGILNCVYGSVNTTDTKDGEAEDVTSFHKWGWSPDEIMYDHLVWGGFTNIKFLPVHEGDTHPVDSSTNFRIEAEKPRQS